MAGKKGLSGRPPKTLTAKQARLRLFAHSKVAIDNITASVDAGSIEDSKWLLQSIMPKPAQTIDLGGEGLANSLVELAKQASKQDDAPPGDTPADSMAATCTYKETPYTETKLT